MRNRERSGEARMEDKTMTNFTKNMMIAAAALTIAAGVAGAQTIKAEVPFGFRAAGTAMPAGSYVVRAGYQSGGSMAVTLTNEDTHRSMITLPYAHNIRKPGEDPVSLTFECTGTDCTLVQLAPGSGRTYRFWKPNSESDGNTRVAVIRAVLVNAR
jgi:hypothetical protein